jgi:hypothetical protein
MTKPALVAPLLACAGRDRQQQGGESTTLLAPGRRRGPLRRRGLDAVGSGPSLTAKEPIRLYYLLLGAAHESPACAPAVTRPTSRDAPVAEAEVFGASGGVLSDVPVGMLWDQLVGWATVDGLGVELLAGPQYQPRLVPVSRR